MSIWRANRSCKSSSSKMSQRASAPGRRTLRDRKVSQRVAVVDESTRQQATQARLDALEADNDVGEDAGLAASDDEYVLPQDDDEGDEEVEISDKKRRKKKQGGAAAAAKRRQLRTSTAHNLRMPRSFARLLEDAALDKLPPTTPTYLTAQAGPPAAATATRKFCSVCGNSAPYTCARCSSRYCCRKCYATHVETRCLKFLS